MREPPPPIIITSWTLAHTHTHHIHPSADQQIRSGMLNLCVAEGPCKKSLGHQWRLFWKALSWKAFWDDSRSTEIAPVEEHTTVRAGGWRGDIHTTCPQGTWAHTHTHTFAKLFHKHSLAHAKMHKRFTGSLLLPWSYICTHLRTHPQRPKVLLSLKWFHLRARIHEHRAQHTHTRTQTRTHTCPGRCHSCVLMSAIGKVNLL